MVHYQDFIHPEDDAARRQLEAVPGFNTLAKLYMKLGLEPMIHGLFMAEKIRLSPTQLPEIYNILPPICEKFGIREPQFYLEMNPVPNACTLGDQETFLVVTSGLLEYLDKEELQSVIAHECGHILCRHVFYNTLAYMLLDCANDIGLLNDSLTSPISLGKLGVLVAPIKIALNYWSRRSELSADRAEVVYMGTANPALRALIRLSGGPRSITGEVNVEEYAAQAQAYEDLYQNSTWQKILQAQDIVSRSHPFSAVRVRELLKWEKSDQFQRLKQAIIDFETQDQCVCCPKCGKAIRKNSKFCRYCGTQQ